MDQILNELSLDGSYANLPEGKDGFERLIKLSILLAKIGFCKTIRTTRDLQLKTIAPDFSVYQWSIDNGHGCDKDIQRHFLTYATKGLYIEDFLDDHEDSTSTLVEFTCDNNKALGPGLAYLWGTFALSLDCTSSFCQEKLALIYKLISHNGEDTKSVEVISIWTSDQIEQLGSELRRIVLSQVRSGQYLVENANDLFPAIKLNESASRQLEGMTGSEQFFPEIIRHFSVLNETMLSWTSGPFTPSGITFSPESESTLNQYGRLREFNCRDNVTRRFSLHTKLMSANQRIHYFPIPDERVVHVGYVGGHLPTTRHNT